MRTSKAFRLLISALFAASGLPAAVTVSLVPSVSSVQVGRSVFFTAKATDSANAGASFTYQFGIRHKGLGNFAILKDFYKTDSVSWTPNTYEDTYEVQVIARSSSGELGSQIETVDVTPRVTGNSPLISSTGNPLIALYSMPACQAPAKVRVRFRFETTGPWVYTPYKNCGGTTLNFYIAGMKESSSYQMQQEVTVGTGSSFGAPLSFTTGAIPANSGIPNHMILKSAEPPTSTTYPVLFHSGIPSMFATDLEGNVIWYSARFARPDSATLGHVFPGGYMAAMNDEPATNCPGTTIHCADHRFFREYDVATHIVRETNWSALNIHVNQWRQAEHRSPVNLTYFNHEGAILPNGSIMTLVTDERIADQGDGAVDVLGDAVVVFDSDFHLKWYWDAFDHLDLKRKANKDEKCRLRAGGCPVLFNKQPNGQYYTTANDWTHANSVSYDPKDGNLLVSLRHQSWVIKIDYRNGAGDGHVIWRLGPGGDFELPAGTSSDTWFNYQHDAEFQANGLLTLFDNNNARIDADSRGHAWRLDENARLATPVVNVNLGVRSTALGSAALLSNGNYTFGAGFIDTRYGQTIEVTPSGTVVFKAQADQTTYRTFRLPSLYGLP